MATAESVIWGIHGGKTGDADSLFLKHNHIALGWAEAGDLSGLKPDRDAFRAKVAATYPK
jgi:restriction system protein